MPPTTELRSPAITPNSFVSIGLMLALASGAMLYGQQMQQVKNIESSQAQFRLEMTSELRELRAEVRDLRSAFAQTQPTGR
jgi:uncharacterized protein HemX